MNRVPAGSFTLAALGRSEFGRTKVKLEWEVKPLGSLLDGTNLERSTTWTDSGTAGVELAELVDTLATDDTPYHWRARILYHPATTPYGRHSRWLTPTWNGTQESDLRSGYFVDTDQDGVLDVIEVATCTSEFDVDSDDDGIADGEEDANRDGILGVGETDPCVSDTDGDGVKDGTELGVVTPVLDPDGAGPLLGTDVGVFVADADAATTSDPLNADSDGDGLSDGYEDGDGNGRLDVGETLATSTLSGPGFPAVFAQELSADTAAQTNASYGRSVAQVGDVNGDGHGDVVVGAPFQVTGGPLGGTAYLLLGDGSGGLTLSSWSPWTEVGSNQAGANFGLSVAGAGDVNGDGYADVLVGSPLYDGGGFNNRGRVYLYLGGSGGLASTAAWKAEGPLASATNMNFGFAVSGAGDVDGDTYPDVVVGAPNASNGQAGEGLAYVYYGGGGTSGVNFSRAAVVLEQNEAGARLGFSVAGAGDVNGDGRAEVVVGANQSGNGGFVTRGRAYVYLGATGGLNGGQVPLSLDGAAQAGAFLGQSVAGVGDVDDDGYDDVMVGAPGHDVVAGSNADEGRFYVYYGSPSGFEATPTVVDGPEALGVTTRPSQFGFAVTGAGDVDADGYADVLVGAYDGTEVTLPTLPEATVMRAGRVQLYRGGAQGLVTVPVNWQETGPDDAQAPLEDRFNLLDGQFGYALSGGKDLNEDGFADVVIGAPQGFVDPGRSPAGRAGLAYVYLGRGPDLDGDGVPDGRETCGGGAGALDRDSDDDGLADNVEDTNLNGVVDAGETNPCMADSDGDGLQDGTEVGVTTGVTDPDGAGRLGGTGAGFVADADAGTTTDALEADSDGDGYSDGAEDLNGNGAVDAGETDATDANSNPGNASGEPVQVRVPIPTFALAVLGVLLVAVGHRQGSRRVVKH
jgi:hypothetical protein